MVLKTFFGALICAVIGAIIGPSICASFTTVYVFQTGEYRILGALIGAILGALVALVSSGSPPKKLSLEFELKEGEQILTEVKALYSFSSGSSHGRMRITNQRFLFKSESTSMEWVWEYISDVHRVKSLGINTHFIELTTTAGNQKRFRLDDNDISIENLLEIFNNNMVKNR
jgi:MFS family permease